MSNASRGAPEQGRGVSVLMAVQQVRRLSPVPKHRDNGPLLLTTGLPGLSTDAWGLHSSNPLSNLSPSRTVPEAGEDAGGRVISRTSCLGSHTKAFQRQPEGVTQKPAGLAWKSSIPRCRGGQAGRMGRGGGRGGGSKGSGALGESSAPGKREESPLDLGRPSK